MKESVLAYDLRPYRSELWVFLCLLTVLAGLRFSDGSMLVAISRGATIADPVFAESASQYVWDSPLKIALLRAMPPNVVVIAISFSLIAVLPVIGLFSTSPRVLWLTSVVLFLTPAHKISVQNIGVGDGFVLVLILLAFVRGGDSRSVFCAFLLIALWHPQQSFFVGVSFLLGRYCYSERLNRGTVLSVLGALSVGGLFYLLFKHSLGFSYSGREVYLVQNFGRFLERNLAFAPFALAPSAVWLGLSRPGPRRGQPLAAAWILVLTGIALVTTDVTRVLTITSLPFVLYGADSLMADRKDLPKRAVILAAGLVALIPVCSWSGLDWWLWPDLISDLRKWGLI